MAKHLTAYQQQRLMVLAEKAGVKITGLKVREVKLTRKEIRRIERMLQSQGLTILVKRNGGPMKAYSQDGYGKAVASAKKKQVLAPQKRGL